MKRLCILLFFLCPLFAKGQGFIRPYDLGHPGMVFTNLLLHGDTLIASGIVIQDTFPYLTLLSLAKLDTNGNVLAHYSYADSLGSHYSFGATPRGFLRCADGSGYIMLGHAFSRSTGLAMKIGNNGEQVWVKEYPDINSRQDIYRKIIEVGDGYLIGGHKQRLDFSTDIFVKKINHHGEEAWERWYGTTNNRRDLFGDMLMLGDNEYVIGGSTVPNQGVPWQQTSYTIKIFAIDSLGNELWGWESAPSLDELQLFGLNLNAAGNWIYATARGEFEFDGFMRHQPRVIVRDSDFEIVRALDMADFGGNVGNFFHDLVPLADGGYLGVGSTRVPVDSPIVAVAHLRAWMSRMDMHGDTLWERKEVLFPDTLFATRQYLHSAVELPSGSIIAAGYYASASDPKDWGMLIKVGPDGCLDTLFCSPVSAVSPIVPDLEVSLYPNPASSTVHIRSEGVAVWDRIEVYNAAGQAVRVLHDSREGRVELGGLPDGVYFICLVKGRQSVTKKVIKKRR
jgi:hypothetical protein